MKLLLQAGIHLIKKVITFVIYGRSVQVFKACTLFFVFPRWVFLLADFSSWEGFVPQISQIYTDFLHHDFSSSDFTDDRRHSCLSDYSRIFAELWPLANGSRPIYAPVVLVTQISLMTQIFLRGRVLSHRFHRYAQIFYGISGESLCPISGGICNDRTGRICENPWVIATAGNLRINSVSSDDEKNLRHLRNLRDKKTSQEKSV